MRVEAVVLVVLLVACVKIQTGACVVEETIPESGSTVAGGEGESVTFYCRVLNAINGTQVVTEWFIQSRDACCPQTIVGSPGSNFVITGDPLPNSVISGQTFRTNLTIQSLTSDLDRANLFCGRGGTPPNIDATFTLRVYTASPTPTPRPPDVRMVGDPHYSILLPNGQLLCFTVHGQSGFSFNLISNKQMHMNALFVQDPKREEITWIGSLGVVVRGTRYKSSNITKLQFDASEKKIYIGKKVTLLAQKVERLTLSKGKLSIAEFSSKPEHPVVHVDLQDVGLSLTVRFKRFHLDIVWNKVDKQPKGTHGLIGQFFRKRIKIDKSRRLLLLGPDMEPVPVMRKPVWSFMERETPEDQLCWAAMNPGYQGKRLIQGHYLDYLVDDVLSSDFKFGQPRHKKSRKLKSPK